MPASSRERSGFLPALPKVSPVPTSPRASASSTSQGWVKQIKEIPLPCAAAGKYNRQGKGTSDANATWVSSPQLRLFLPSSGVLPLAALGLGGARLARHSVQGPGTRPRGRCLTGQTLHHRVLGQGYRTHCS